MRIAHKIMLGTRAYKILLPDLYDDISSYVGVFKASVDNDTTDYAGKIKISDGVMNGQIVRIVCRLSSGKEVTVVCESSRFTTAMGSLLGRKINGQTVTTTRIPRRMRLG